MRSAAYVGNHEISVGDGESTAPHPGDVQIAVAYTGLCGTDLHILHGNMDRRVSTPLIFGHEMSGTIVAVGDGVDGWAVGDAVTVMPLDWDGTCPACLAGNSHICQNLNFVGIDSPGSLQQLWNVRADLLVALPPGLALDTAALSEPVAVAVHDVRRSELVAGDRVVVIGGG
ncbi:MAG: alcohol dehydrogenase catalytic domain-containing protein, partial [Pseudolysinimonas sp.]